MRLPWHFCQSSVESSVSVNPQVQGVALPHWPCPWTDSCIHRLLFTFTWTSKGISCHRLELKPVLLLSPSVWWMATPFWWLETKPLGSFLTPLFLLHLRFYPLMNTVTFTSIILPTLSDHISPPPLLFPGPSHHYYLCRFLQLQNILLWSPWSHPCHPLSIHKAAN